MRKYESVREQKCENRKVCLSQHQSAFVQLTHPTACWACLTTSLIRYGFCLFSTQVGHWHPHVPMFRLFPPLTLPQFLLNVWVIFSELPLWDHYKEPLAKWMAPEEPPTGMFPTTPNKDPLRGPPEEGGSHISYPPSSLRSLCVLMRGWWWGALFILEARWRPLPQLERIYETLSNQQVLTRGNFA